MANPTAGRALINGTPIEAAHPDARSLGVYIEPTGAHPGHSAHQPPALARGAGEYAGRPCRRGARDLVGLTEAGRPPRGARTPPACASGSGWRLPCSATRATLVLDEPLNGLDPQGIRWLRTLLRERAAAGGTVLLSSHVLTEAAQTVDDVVVIHHGRLAFEGAIGELTRLGGGSRVAVGTPNPERLAAAVRQAGGRVQLEGAPPGADRRDGRGAGGGAGPSRAREPARRMWGMTPRSSRCSLA